MLALFGGHNLPPLVDIGLTYLPKSGRAMAFQPVMACSFDYDFQSEMAMLQMFLHLSLILLSERTSYRNCGSSLETPLGWPSAPV